MSLSQHDKRRYHNNLAWLSLAEQSAPTDSCGATEQRREAHASYREARWGANLSRQLACDYI